MVPMLTVTRASVSASPAPDSGSEIGFARWRWPRVTAAGAWNGKSLELLQPVERARAAGRWRWCRDGRARRAPASRSPRPRPTSGPSRRSARPWASRRRRRCWRRPARAARAPACSRCRASPCSPRRRQASARSRPPRRRDARRAARRPAASRPCRPSCRRRRGHRACRPSARRPAAARSRPGLSRIGKVSRWPLKISRRPGRAPLMRPTRLTTRGAGSTRSTSMPGISRSSASATAATSCGVARRIGRGDARPAAG